MIEGMARLLAIMAIVASVVAAPLAMASGPTSATAPPQELVSALQSPAPAQVIPLAALERRVEAGGVRAGIVDTTRGWVTARGAGDTTWASALPDGAKAATTAAEVSRQMTANGVLVLAAPAATPAAAAAPSGGTSLMPFLVGGLLLATMLTIAMVNRVRGGGTRIGSNGMGDGGKRRKKSPTPPVRFDDVAGCEEAVEELAEVVGFLRDPAPFEKVGAAMPRGVILHGPPGTGKTLLAKAVAGEAGVPFFAASGSDFVEMYVGTGASRVRKLFADARKEKHGAVIFIDEIDAIGRARGGGPGTGADSERDQTLNQLLVAMDGFGTNGRIVVIAATNRLDMLDKALLRPGRFDRHVQVPLPAQTGRREILGLHARGKPLADDVSLDDLATVTAGMSGAELANVLNEAAIMAARAGREVIGPDDLAEGHLRAIAGAERRDSPLADGEREVIAYHEAGHCLAAELCPTHVPTQRVSIRARGRAAGLALYGQTDRSLHSPQDIHERMLVALAGRAAEELVMGQVSSGAANDLEVVNGLARPAVSTLGFSTAIGQLQGGDVSDDTRRRIDAEVTRMVEDAYGDALDLLAAHRDQLDAMADALLESDELTRDQIDDIISHRTPVRRPRRVAARVGRQPSAAVAPVAARRRSGRPLRVVGAAASVLIHPIAALRPRRRIRSLP